MRINFLVNEVLGGWEPDDTRLGGTEESVVRWSEELVKRGHEVEVHRNPRHGKRTETTIHNGVWYKPRRHECNPDILINVKSPDDKVASLFPEPLTLYLTNETDATQKDLSKYAGVIWPSAWAEESIPVNNPVRYVLSHGYDETKIYPGKKVPKQCLYASSPDRGLMTLLKAWPQVIAKHPDATLKVTYGAPEYDVSGVEFLGEVDEKTMNQLYRESDIWCHPCNGGELYGMTGVKAQAAGCVPVVIPTMALIETVRHGYFASEQTYTDMLIRALSEPKKREDIRKAMLAEHYPTWEDSTTRLLEIIETALI